MNRRSICAHECQVYIDEISKNQENLETLTHQHFSQIKTYLILDKTVLPRMTIDWWTGCIVMASSVIQTEERAQKL